MEKNEQTRAAAPSGEELEEDALLSVIGIGVVAKALCAAAAQKKIIQEVIEAWNRAVAPLTQLYSFRYEYAELRGGKHAAKITALDNTWKLKLSVECRQLASDYAVQYTIAAPDMWPLGPEGVYYRSARNRRYRHAAAFDVGDLWMEEVQDVDAQHASMEALLAKFHLHELAVHVSMPARPPLKKMA